MAEPVFDPDYWRGRVNKACARGEIHRSIFHGTPDKMAEVQAAQADELFRTLTPDQTVLDLGCGYGRLLDMMHERFGRVPPTHHYLGVDVSPDLVEVARHRWSTHWFQVADLRTFKPDVYPESGGVSVLYDTGVLLWVRQPVVGNVGEGEWGRIVENCEQFCRQLVIVH